MSDSSDEGETFQLRNYDEDESDDERPNKRRKTMKQSTLRSRGLGFVSATAQDEDEDKEDEEDPDDERPTMGIGMGMGGFRNAFNIGEYNDEVARKSPSPEVSSGAQTPQATGRGPSAFGAGGNIQKNSFAARMMAKQGYVEGQGLGKSGQGITAPIQTQVLQSRAGLGHGSEPERPKKTRPKNTPGDGSRIPASGTSTPRIKAPPKAKYNVTAIESRGLQIPDAMKSIIIDATGAETKTISSLSGFSTPTSESAPSEVAKASSRIKMQLQAYAEAWDATKEQEARFAQEEEQLEAINAVHLSEIQRYQDIITEFERVSMDDSGESRAWDQITLRLQEVQDRFADYIEELELPEITASCLEAPFRRELVDWEPLTNPENLVQSFQSIGALLELEKSILPHQQQQHRKRTTPFETLLLQHWFPRLRTAMKEWSVYDPEPATLLISAWTPILPSWLLYKALDEIILPKLIEAVRRFPKTVESNATNSKINGSSSSKKRMAPDLHSWLFDWWSLLSSESLDLERFSELRTLVKSKIDSTAWPIWKPLLGSLRSHAKSTATPSRVTSKAQPAPEAIAMEDISFKDLVQAWCADNDLVLRSSGQSDAFGRLLYRLQGAERRSKGLLICFQGDVVLDEDGEPYGLDEKLIERALRR